MKLDTFADLYSKLLGNHTLKIMKNTWKFTLKTWKNHRNIKAFCQSGKVGTLGIPTVFRMSGFMHAQHKF